jgi:hypothetical protein
MRLKTLLAISTGVFGAGIGLGVVAARRGIPPDQIQHWLTVGAASRLIHAVDWMMGWQPRVTSLPEAAPIPAPRSEAPTLSDSRPESDVAAAPRKRRVRSRKK